MTDAPASGNWRKIIKAIPVVGPVAKYLHRLLVKPPTFQSSPQYWEERYSKGGNSGAGSYRRLAQFKADVLNQFVAEQGITSVVELGSGDGAQLELAHYPAYTGIDVSQRAVKLCADKFRKDPTKSFIHTSQLAGGGVHADIALSLDVIYHLVEDEIFDNYMAQLFSLSDKYICVYSSNFDGPGPDVHVRHRCFSDWIARNAPGWELFKNIPNAYPYDASQLNETSWADFYFFKKALV